MALGYNPTSAKIIKEFVSEYEGGINRVIQLPLRERGFIGSSEKSQGESQWEMSEISKECPPTGNSQMQTLPLQHQWELTRILHLETDTASAVAQTDSPSAQIECTSVVSLPDQLHSSMSNTNTSPALFRDSGDSSLPRPSQTFPPTRNSQTPSAGKAYFARHKEQRS
jgi:hypothetical protein